MSDPCDDFRLSGEREEAEHTSLLLSPGTKTPSYPTGHAGTPLVAADSVLATGKSLGIAV